MENTNQMEVLEIQTKISESIWHYRKKKRNNETENKANWSTERQKD